MKIKNISNPFIVLITVLQLYAVAYPPDPENAALLYYQAFISFPQAHDTFSKQLSDVAQGKAEPNEVVSTYVRKCADVLELTEAASELTNCDWGYRYSQGFDALMPNLTQIRSLAYLVLTDARIALQKGDYQRALERCLVCKQVSRHVGDDTIIAFLVGVAIEQVTNNSIRAILGTKQVSSEVLTRFQHQLRTRQMRALTLSNALKTETQLALAHMVADNPEFVEFFEQTIKEAHPKDKSRLKGDREALYAAARKYYQDYMTSVQATLADNLSYTQRYTELLASAERVTEDVKTNDKAMLTGVLAPSLTKLMSREVELESNNNALETAVIIMQAYAKTGTFPKTLPADSPVDAFSGKAFTYELTKTGFILRCCIEDPSRENKLHEFIVP